jgi:hypothetical protein
MRSGETRAGRGIETNRLVNYGRLYTKPRKIVIAGGTGFLGRPLCAALAGDGHEVVVLTRNGQTRTAGGTRAVAWELDRALSPWEAELDGAGAVINLAGEPIAGHRWSAAQKRRIEDSRVTATRRLATAITEAAAPPPVFISSASGLRPTAARWSEETGAGHDFLPAYAGARRTGGGGKFNAHARGMPATGLVLAHDGGALPKMLPPFRLGLGGRLGSGRQYWPWIHRTDWVNLVRFLIGSPDAVGAVNATAPTPVTNAEFTAELGRVRPADDIPVPGPRCGSCSARGRRAVAQRPRDAGEGAAPGFTFTYPLLSLALDAALHHGEVAEAAGRAVPTCLTLPPCLPC